MLNSSIHAMASQQLSLGNLNSFLEAVMYYERFRELCSENAVRPGTVARETDISTSTMTSWKQGKYTPKQDKLQRIADFFGVSLEYLMGIDKAPSIANEKVSPNPNTKDVVYQRYCELRDRAGLTDYAVSQAAGISRTTLAEWGRGKYVPKQDKLQKLANCFGVTLEYFTKGADLPPKYYENPKTAQIAQAVFDDPDLMLLFEAAKDVKPENIRLAAEMLRRFKETNE
jgi:transcriptional regulator with XRE-family HTH domain